MKDVYKSGKKKNYHSIKNAILSYLLMRNVENKEKRQETLRIL